MCPTLRAVSLCVVCVLLAAQAFGDSGAASVLVVKQTREPYDGVANLAGKPLMSRPRTINRTLYWLSKGKYRDEQVKAVEVTKDRIVRVRQITLVDGKRVWQWVEGCKIGWGIGPDVPASQSESKPVEMIMGGPSPDAFMSLLAKLPIGGDLLPARSITMTLQEFPTGCETTATLSGFGESLVLNVNSVNLVGEEVLCAEGAVKEMSVGDWFAPPKEVRFVPDMREFFAGVSAYASEQKHTEQPREKTSCLVLKDLPRKGSQVDVEALKIVLPEIDLGVPSEKPIGPEDR